MRQSAPGTVGTGPPTAGGLTGLDIPHIQDGTVTIEGGGIGIVGIISPFVVPGFLAVASGSLLIVLMLIQAIGTLAWLPVIRRRIGSFGIGRGD